MDMLKMTMSTDLTPLLDDMNQKMNEWGQKAFVCIIILVFSIILIVNIVKTIKALRDIANSSEIITNHVDVINSNITTMTEIQKKQSGIISISNTPAPRGRRTYK